MSSDQLALNLVAQSLRNISDALETIVRMKPVEQTTSFAQPSESEHLTTEEAAKFLKCQPNTLAIWRLRGTGPKYAGIGNGKRRTIRYAKSDLETFLRERTR